MAGVPLGFQLHILAAFALFAFWPFTRLVHAFSAPVGYLTRPYVVYRSRDTRPGLRPDPARLGRPADAAQPAATRPTPDDDRDGQRPRRTTSHDRRRPRRRHAARPAPPATWCWPPSGSLVNFWAWALLGPLGPGVKERLGLSFAAQSLLVAVPVWSARSAGSRSARSPTGSAPGSCSRSSASPPSCRCSP